MKRVYFVKEEHGNVKVGFSAYPKLRRDAGQVWNSDKLILLGSIPGDRTEEQHCHYLLESHHIRGEWFEWNDESEAIIKKILDGEDYPTIMGWLHAERNTE